MRAEAEARLLEALEGPAPRRAPGREYVTLKAATTAATERGEFTAVVSAEDPDRERDIVSAQAMVEALRRWIPTAKLIPLSWAHSTKPEDQIGSIDPRSVEARGAEVIARGKIDMSTPRGAEVWRLVKSRTLGFSFGFISLKATPRPGGGRRIEGLDVFEVSCTPTPVQRRTRVLSWKGARREPPTLGALRELEREVGVGELEVARRRDLRSLRRRADDLALECAIGFTDPPLDALKQVPAANLAVVAVTDPIAVEARRQVIRCMTSGPAKPLAELRQEAARVEREFS